jgi:hypothetical protein
MVRRDFSKMRRGCTIFQISGYRNYNVAVSSEFVDGLCVHWPQRENQLSRRKGISRNQQDTESLNVQRLVPRVPTRKFVATIGSVNIFGEEFLPESVTN